LNIDDVAAFISIFLPSASGAARRARRSQRPPWTSGNAMRSAS